ncbi:MAG: twin-arginine translocation pathway signal protein, partial [Alphaproteobacteria bacterium HGW-Alphaproteobacteria-12]
MATTRRNLMTAFIALAALVSIGAADLAYAATAEDLNQESEHALDKLYKTNQ